MIDYERAYNVAMCLIEQQAEMIRTKDEALMEARKCIARLTPMGHDGMDDAMRSVIDAVADQADMTRAKVTRALGVQSRG